MNRKNRKKRSQIDPSEIEVLYSFFVLFCFILFCFFTLFCVYILDSYIGSGMVCHLSSLPFGA